ncbi:hypothetical protein [Parasphingorhabdus flavimaris]|uniref:hypothetical protein n=1 Tax=Parasphingorhabdus flavimaris TaxID=266812 RepID=UPI0030024CD6
MIFEYLHEIRKHISFLAFLAFAVWLAVLTGLELVFGHSGSDDEPFVPPPPVIAAHDDPRPPFGDKPKGIGEDIPPAKLANKECLNIEGTIICQGQ